MFMLVFRGYQIIGKTPKDTPMCFGKNPKWIGCLESEVDRALRVHFPLNLDWTTCARFARTAVTWSTDLGLRRRLLHWITD